MRQYFILKNNEKVGPLPVDQLLQQGLTPSSMVWAEGMENWQPASQVAELANLFNPQPAASVPHVAPAPQPANNPLQKIFKIILYVILGLTSLYGLIMFFFSFGVMAAFVFPGLVLMFMSMAIIAITIIAVVRMIKNQKFGFLTLGFFALVFFFSLLSMIVFPDDASVIFLWLFICGLMGIPCAIFATIPINNFGGGFSKLLKEPEVIDYVLLGIYAMFATLILFTY